MSHAIRKPLTYPKPKGAIAKAAGYEKGSLLCPRRLDHGERILLRYIVERGHMVEVRPAVNVLEIAGVLQVELPAWLVDELAAFEADLAEHEPDQDREDDGCAEENGDDEPDVDEELNGDDEPNWTSPLPWPRMPDRWEDQGKTAREFRSPADKAEP